MVQSSDLSNSRGNIGYRKRMYSIGACCGLMFFFFLIQLPSRFLSENKHIVLLTFWSTTTFLFPTANAGHHNNDDDNKKKCNASSYDTPQFTLCQFWGASTICRLSWFLWRCWRREGRWQSSWRENILSYQNRNHFVINCTLYTMQHKPAIKD